jgi:DNA polymerase-4
MRRYILHVDMDAFFAAVEQRNRPELKGKPVIVGADPRGGKGRGVVSTCSYEARRFGVRSAMPITEAYRRCPQGIYLPPNGRLYSEVSGRIFEILTQFSDLVEPLSIDEAFLDITHTVPLFKTPLNLALELKKKIFEQEKLVASVGIAPNKFLAKIASDLEKPDGLVIVNEEDVERFLFPLTIDKMWGIGAKSVNKFHSWGIRTIGDLAEMPRDILESRLGKGGTHLHFLAHGIDERGVIAGEGVKSVSNEITFSNDTADQDLMQKTLFRLSEKVGYRLRKKELKGKTIHLKLRYAGFETITRNRTIDHLTANTESIFNTVRELFERNYQSGRKVRLLGVGVSGFLLADTEQLSLFDINKTDTGKLDSLEDKIKEKFGTKSVLRAESLLPQEKAREIKKEK